jgi:hypothetical protein
MVEHTWKGILFSFNMKSTAGLKLYNQTSNKRIKHWRGAFSGPGIFQRVGR